MCLALVTGLLVPSATAQVDLDSEVRQSLEGDIREYQELLERRSRELEEIQAQLGETAAALAARIAERDTISAELVERRQEREQVVAQIAELDARRVATEGRIAGLQDRLGQMSVRVSELLVNLYKQRGNRRDAHRKQKQLLAEALRQFFQIDGDPFILSGKGGWSTRFILTAEEGSL